MAGKTALMVRGGWDGHAPQATSDRFKAFLEADGVEVTVVDGEVHGVPAYDDAEALKSYDLIVQTWTMGSATDDQVNNLVAAVESGTGLAGWHGGIVDSFRASLLYLRLTGGQFLEHVGGQIDYAVRVADGAQLHPIVKGVEPFAVHTEQYWVMSDDYNDVLAVTDVAADASTPWLGPITVPVIWTRQWGKGKIFVNTIGHQLSDFDTPEVELTIRRGLQWAIR